MYRSLVIRRDYEDLNDWIFRAKVFYMGMCEIIGNPAEIRWNAGGVSRLGHWKDKTTLSKYIGHEYWKILFEELTQSIETLEEYKMILGSLRIPVSITNENPKIIPQIFGTTNPGGPGHDFCKKYFVDKARNKTYIDPDSGFSRIFIPCLATDNPANSEKYHSYLNGLLEPLRSAWRDGSWDTFVGQFFTMFGTHLREEPFEIPEKLAADRLFGSLDIGTGHPTTFRLHFVDMHGIIHRLFTYSCKGYTHRHHAQEIYNKIRDFRWTGGMFPRVVWTGHDFNTKQNANEWTITSPRTQYEEIFEGRGVTFVLGNTEREHGCDVMKELFTYKDGMPEFKYWRGYNTTFETSIQAMILDENHRETYKKKTGDDTPDEFRYGACGMRGEITTETQMKIRNKKHPASNITHFDTDSYVEENYAGQFQEISLG